MTQRRPLALGAAITIGFGSLFLASPAFAQDAEAPTDQQQAQETQEESLVSEAPPAEEAADLQAAGIDVVAIGADANGGTVLVQTEGSETGPRAQAAIDALAAEKSTPVNVVTISQMPTAWAATDVVGGAGYLANEASFCSIGFSAWDPKGEPVLLTAGHCTNSGKYSTTELVLPSDQPAETGLEPGTGGTTNGTGALGKFGFAQFGGPGHSVAELDEDGNPILDENERPVDADDTTDIAVIENLDAKFDVLPEVTDWSTAAEDDLAAKTIEIKSADTTDPVTGSALSKSGRTTGLTSGTVGDIVDGWSLIGDTNGEPHWVRGFKSDVVAKPGDSGGAVFQGDNALGVISGGVEAKDNNGQQFTWTASLKHALPHIPDYTVALDIDEPVVKTAVADGIDGGSDIVVTVPNNAAELSISGDSDRVIPVDGTEVSFTAPSEPGNYSYTLVAQNGFSKSEPVEVNFEVVLAAPGVNDIISEGTDVTLTGTGVPGAELAITVTPEAEGADPVSLPGTVNEDGTWSVPTELAYGTYTVSATQTFEDQISAAGTGTVSVVPAAPAITSVKPGATFEAADAPSSISGTGIDGANVVVKLNGEEVGAPAEGAASALAAVVGTDGTWTIDLGAQLGAGAYTVDATQAINGATSSATSLVFNVAAAPVPPVAPVDPGAPGAPADPSNPAAPGGQGGTGGAELVNTGTGFSMLPFGLAALGMLILGGGAIVFTQRRLQATAAE